MDVTFAKHPPPVSEVPVGDSQGGISVEGSDPALVEDSSPAVITPQKNYNHWTEDENNVIFWKVNPTKGFIQLRKQDCERCTGERRTQAYFESGMEDCFEDWCFVDPSIPEDDLCQARRKRIRTEPWIGSVHFPKIPGPSEEAPSVAISPMQVRTTIAQVREQIGEGSLMSDQMINPCAQEAENWPQMMQDIEQERSRLEEICWFEREVTQRMAVTR